MTLLWDGGVRAGRIDAQRFVELTAAAAARIFGLWSTEAVALLLTRPWVFS